LPRPGSIGRQALSTEISHRRHSQLLSTDFRFSKKLTRHVSSGGDFRSLFPHISGLPRSCDAMLDLEASSTAFSHRFQVFQEAATPC
ncbi:hypothetical protein BgiMline_025145, partial [Biomphalaria glabrata]